MGRPVVLSNGELFVGLDEHGFVHDFYYPYVGQENLTTARSTHHKIGVWADGFFSWLDDGSWNIKADFEEQALISNIIATHNQLALTLKFQDFVDKDYNCFGRIITVENGQQKARDVRIFLHQVFQISSNGRGDTALYVPQGHYLFDYKGKFSLLMYARTADNKAFDQYAVGNYGIEGKEGTFRDAEDGELSGSNVEHAGVDSVMRLKLALEPTATETIEYWTIANDSQYYAEQTHKKILSEGLQTRLEATRAGWHHWIKKALSTTETLKPVHKTAFLKSLLVVKAHIDKRGGIIASGDSSIYNYGRDYYSYVWPRDGGLTILPLIELGFFEEAKNFLQFCAGTIHPAGYMMHKYQPDQAIGSTWHPLLHNAHPELAIQEDETATIVYALGKYLEKSGDAAFVESVYTKLLLPAADFMARFIDEQTNLPHPSYDLWEQQFATFTYSVCVVQASLTQAIAVAEHFKRTVDAERWRVAQKRIAEGMHLLHNPASGGLRKSISIKDNGDLEFNDTIDVSSAFGAMRFGGSFISGEQLNGAFAVVEKLLYNQSPAGGVIRYEHDDYFLQNPAYKGNPWTICTLWLAQYYILQNRREEAEQLVEWSLSHACSSGMMAEQLDAATGQPTGVLPLVWSHAELLNTLLLLRHGN